MKTLKKRKRQVIIPKSRNTITKAIIYPLLMWSPCSTKRRRAWQQPLWRCYYLLCLNSNQAPTSYHHFSNPKHALKNCQSLACKPVVVSSFNLNLRVIAKLSLRIYSLLLTIMQKAFPSIWNVYREMASAAWVCARTRLCCLACGVVWFQHAPLFKWENPSWTWKSPS